MIPKSITPFRYNELRTASNKVQVKRLLTLTGPLWYQKKNKKEQSWGKREEGSNHWKRSHSDECVRPPKKLKIPQKKALDYTDRAHYKESGEIWREVILKGRDEKKSQLKEKLKKKE
jgi:hypothetical protein